MLVNTIVIPIFINFGRTNWFQSAGLVNDVFYNSLSIAFLNPTVYLIGPTYILKLCRQRIEIMKGAKSKLTQ